MINEPLSRERVARRQQQPSLFVHQILDTRSLMESPQQLCEGNTIIMLQTRGQRLSDRLELAPPVGGGVTSSPLFWAVSGESHRGRKMLTSRS